MIENKPLIYFAHPVGSYGTKLEQEIILFLEKDWTVINPNRPEIQILCGKNMANYCRIINDFAQAVVGLSYGDGKWGAGVYLELLAGSNKGIPLFQVEVSDRGLKLKNLNSKKIVPLSIENTVGRNYCEKWNFKFLG